MGQLRVFLFALLSMGCAVLAAFSTPASAATARSASTFDQLFQDPNNADLNRKYAAEAEAQGKLRLALSALERARAARPDDQEIFREFERVRTALLPAATAVTWQVGGAYSSNSRQANSGPLKRDDIVGDAALIVQDERTLLGKRWRTLALAAGQFQRDFEDLNAARVFVESGPLFPLTEDLWLQVAPGANFVWLDGQHLFSDVSASATLGASFWGMTQTLTARYSWRFGEGLNYSDAELFELNARVAGSPSLVKGDLLFMEPRFRMAQPDNLQAATLLLPTVVSDTTLVARDLAPLDYREWGVRVSYLFPLAQGKVWLGAGFGIYDRRFDSPVLDQGALAQGVTVGTDENRHDLYLEPTAHVIFPNLIAPNVDLRADYRFETNTSNDDSREFENHVAGMRIVGRF